MKRTKLSHSEKVESFMIFSKILLGIAVFEVLMAMQGKEMFKAWNLIILTVLGILAFSVLFIGIFGVLIYEIVTGHRLF